MLSLRQSIELVEQCDGVGNLLMYIAYRCGRECGEIQRALSSAGISWGTYQDSLGTHCNAHANNMVVVPPSIRAADRWLAMLDLDMAFTRDMFVPELVDDQVHPNPVVIVTLS